MAGLTTRCSVILSFDSPAATSAITSRSGLLPTSHISTKVFASVGREALGA
jgi:hypothetical protein